MMQLVDNDVDPYADCRQLIECVEDSSIRGKGSLTAFFEMERDLSRTPDYMIQAMLRLANSPECCNHPTSEIIRRQANLPSFRAWLAAGLGLM